MSSSLLDAAFAHNVWATSRVIDACLGLSVEELETSVIGTRGPLLETLRHLVHSDAEELFFLTGNVTSDIDEEQVSLAEAREMMCTTAVGTGLRVRYCSRGRLTYRDPAST